MVSETGNITTVSVAMPGVIKAPLIVGIQVVASVTTSTISIITADLIAVGEDDLWRDANA
jgi:hypothetical protein